MARGLPALLLAASCRGGEAWGPDGHTIVAHIADELLPAPVAKVLADDLNKSSLSDVANWADDFDHTDEGRWSEPLHFIDYPGQACNFVWTRDCQGDRCNPGALVNYSRQVFAKGISAERRLMALKFVIHFMGDLHQPLHASSHDDIGGNLIKVRYAFGADAGGEQKDNLHAVWDVDLLVQDIAELKAPQALRGALGNYTPQYHNWPAMVQNLMQRLRGDWLSNGTAWRQTVAAHRDEVLLRSGLGLVANETAALGCEYAYTGVSGERVKSGDVLHRDYFLRARPVVEQQLAKGGVRLAQLLSDALAEAQEAERQKALDILVV